MRNIINVIDFYAGCILSSSVFGEILERELLETRLCECNFIHSHCELLIHTGMQVEKKNYQKSEATAKRDTRPFHSGNADL